MAVVSPGKTQSISQKPKALAIDGALPDFRNIGVILRVIVLVNVLAVGVVVLRSRSTDEIVPAMVAWAGWLELPLFITVLLLYLAQPVLQRLAPGRFWPVVGMLAVVVTLFAYPPLGVPSDVALWRWLGWSVLASCAVMGYFDYRGRLYSPALTEARLHALTARIRPHFLFNSLNAVLGVMREDPRRAERALEELADMFRVLMKEHKELVSLDSEIGLCERYLDLERLRLGDRLVVNWDLTCKPAQALVPPLLLQPLLENAVYHGIEPSLQPGDIAVRVARRSSEVLIEVSNPMVDTPRAHKGNQIAQANIRERLSLFFDLEADMRIDRSEGRYSVRIRLPYRRLKT